MTRFEENYNYVRNALATLVERGIMWPAEEVMASIDVCIEEAYQRGRREERETPQPVQRKSQKRKI